MKRVSWSNVFVGVLLVWLGSCLSSCAVAQNEPDVQDSGPRLVFRGLIAVTPTAYVRGLWWDVQHCLQRWDVSPDDVRWGVADAIVDVQGKQLLWGVHANVNWPEGRAASVVVDREVRYSARVLSHEIGHAAGNLPDTDWRLHACTVQDGPYSLPYRPLTDEQLAGLVGN